LKKLTYRKSPNNIIQVSHKDVTNLTDPDEMSVVSIDSDKSSSSKLMDSEIKANDKAAKAAEKAAKEAAKEAKKEERAAKQAAAAAAKEAKAVAKAAKETEKAAKEAEKAEKAEKAEPKEAKKPGRPKKAAAANPLETEIAELRLRMAALQEQCVSLQGKMDAIRAVITADAVL